MINRIMTPRAAAVALAASALIAAPVLADEGNNNTSQLRGAPTVVTPDTLGAKPGADATKPADPNAHYVYGFPEDDGYDDDDDYDGYDNDDGYDRPRDHRPGRDAPRHPVRSTPYDSSLIRCESGDYRRQYCQAPYGVTLRDVRITRQRSVSDCIQGYSWGYNRNSIWVTDGCRADFAINRGRGGGGHYGDPYRQPQSDYAALRRQKEQAVQTCTRTLVNRAEWSGWHHAEFTGRPRVQEIGNRKFRVSGTVHLGRDTNERRQQVTCTVRRGEVQRFSDIYQARHDHRPRYGRHGGGRYGY